MKYLEAVVAEILRLYQLAPFLDRVCVKDFEMPSATLHGEPFIVKSGGYIWFPSYSLHRDSKYFPELEKFNPDRFLNSDVDNSVIRNENRICIGNRFAIMEIKIMLFYLLSHYDLKADVKAKVLMVLDKKILFITEVFG
jgi:cytochrome P450 family 9